MSAPQVETIGRTLETMLGGRQVTRFKQNGKQYDVIVQIADVDRTNPDDLSKIYVRGAQRPDDPALQPGRRARIGGAARADPHGPDRARPTSPPTSRRAIRRARRWPRSKRRRARSCRPSAQIDYIGQSREYKQASGDIYFTFVLALLFIYLVLAAQFESFVDPLHHHADRAAVDDRARCWR